MRVDFSNIMSPRIESDVFVPEGDHECRIAQVRVGATSDGAVRWRLRLEVISGGYMGATAAWDSITWTESEMHRAQVILGALGFDVSGVLEVEPENLVDRRVVVTVATSERVEPRTGNLHVRLRVTHYGHRAAPAGRTP